MDPASETNSPDVTTVMSASAAPASAGMPCPGAKFGDYRILERISGGGMGTVYQAEQVSMKRIVAVKLLHQSLSSDSIYLARFTQEVRMLANLSHPNLVQAIEAGVDNGSAYFSMEYVKGLDLKRRIDLKQNFSELDVLRVARDVACAMAYAWNKSHLIHRDLKPANIILSDEGTVKLLDLGISRRASESSTDLTACGMMVGSPTYISPEQARGESDLDFRADIYSLGVTMFHLLAGEPPYDSRNPVAVVSMHLASPIPDVRTSKHSVVSRETAQLIRTMMAKKKEARPPSWEALVREFDRRIEALELPVAAVPSEPAASGPEGLFSRRMQTHRIVALCVLLVLILMAFFAVVRRAVQETIRAKAAARVERLIQLADSVQPAGRTSLIHLLRQEAQTSLLPELRQRAGASAARLEAQIATEQEHIHNKKIAGALELLRGRSRVFEEENKLDDALALWREYQAGGEFRSDPAIAVEVRDSIHYFEQKIIQREQGLLE